ncbi:RNA polymerase sigma factor [uncultured Bacteroides sp.]|uniref:RNA polymerase sigma factor n=1 Tax=uncultured Bacteroides sp. TaxID=162156 RepID=UPI002AAA766A|nr:RNA polymerase sigma factor [uncultured Bacteroides sp.]
MSVSWNEIKKGNNNEWRILFRENAEFLYAYGMKMVHNEDLVKDTVQELFLHIYEKRSTLSKPQFIKAYLCSGLRNRLINELKKESPESLEEGDYRFDLYIDAENSEKYEEEKQYKKIQTLLDRLTNRQREVIYLKYFKGLSNEEIAKALDINKQSVANLISDGLKQMKKDLLFVAFILLILKMALRL